MNTPTKIWLLDCGDEITWCDDPDPAGLGDEAPDSVEYIKAEGIEPLRSDIGAAAWVVEWLTAEKYRKPDIPPLVEKARKHYKETMAENESLKMGREEAVKLVIDAGLSTGHADTCGDLMLEVIGEIESLRAQLDRHLFMGESVEKIKAEKEIESLRDLLQKANNFTGELMEERDEWKRRCRDLICGNVSNDECRTWFEEEL